MLSISNLQKELPKMGDVLHKVPVTDGSTFIDSDPEAYPCTVIYVNSARLWYVVEFCLNGHKFNQGYTLLDGYSEAIDEYWTNLEHKGKRYATLKKDVARDLQMKYTGSATPKYVKSTVIPMEKIITKINNYNKRHHTNLSYGEYMILKRTKKV